MLTDEQARDAVIVALDCTRERALELTDLLARVFNNKFKVFGMGMVLFAGEFYVNDFAIDGFRCICYKILTSEFCMDLRAVLGTV